MKQKPWFLVLLILVCSLMLASCGQAEHSLGPLEAESSGDIQTEYASDQANGTGSSEQDSPGFTGGEKRIYRAEIEIETTKYTETVQALHELTKEVGGYFEQENQYTMDGVYQGFYQNGDFVIRVPVEKFEVFCQKSGQLGHVIQSNSSIEDVSEQYYDMETRLITQRTKLERLQALLKQAASIEDIITLESSISETELEIERLTGSLRKYDSQIQYATIQIDLTEVYKLSNTHDKPDSFGSRVSQAFSDGMLAVGNGLETVVVGIAYSWIWILILAVAALGTWFIVRRSRRSKAKKESLSNNNSESK